MRCARNPDRTHRCPTSEAAPSRAGRARSHAGLSARFLDRLLVLAPRLGSRRPADTLPRRLAGCESIGGESAALTTCPANPDAGLGRSPRRRASTWRSQVDFAARLEVAAALRTGASTASSVSIGRKAQDLGMGITAKSTRRGRPSPWPQVRAQLALAAEAHFKLEAPITTWNPILKGFAEECR